MATIQLLVGNERNRRLLREALDDHEVRTGVESPDAFLDAEFDLCVLDDAAFRSLRETLAAKKERASPVFLPCLLLLGERYDGQATASVWEHVDEIVEVPIERAALTNRIENLLQRRDLSLELDRRKQFTEERFHTLFESTPDPIVVVTDEGVVTEVNDAFTEMFGVEREAVLDRHVSAVDATPTESIERLLLRVDQGSDEDSEDQTVEIDARDGDTYVTELNVDVVEELGDAAERIGIFRDVTGREATQQQLERQVRQLERFASIIAHDLRDPLNTARAKTRLARAECGDESGRLAELEEVHDRMEALVEDVLTLAKQGRAVGETEPVRLEDVVEAAWSTVDAPEAATLRLANEESAESALPVVEADAERLRALLENLFRNAVVHAGPAVTITVGALDGDGGGFYVSDDGPGVPPAEREAVFEFGHTTATEGNGLGLAIVEQIAEAHGWDVSLVDGADGGARFEFEP